MENGNGVHNFYYLLSLRSKFLIEPGQLLLVSLGSRVITDPIGKNVIGHHHQMVRLSQQVFNAV